MCIRDSTNSRDDWFLDGSPTPGFTNYQEPYIPPEESGCNRRNNRPGAGNSPGGCAVSPLPMSAAWLPMVLALGWRRRR